LGLGVGFVTFLRGSRLSTVSSTLIRIMRDGFCRIRLYPHLSQGIQSYPD
jgi:hypothetical protein